MPGSRAGLRAELGGPPKRPGASGLGARFDIELNAQNVGFSFAH